MSLPERSRTSGRKLWTPVARVVLSAGLLAALACGKKGPPLAPLLKGPDRVSSLACKQQGEEVLLTAVLPDKNQDGGPLAAIQEVRIFRLEGGLGQGLTSGRTAQRTAIRQFNRESKRIAALSGEALGKAMAGRRVAYTDPHPLTVAIPEKGREVTYAMTVVDVEKHSSPLSSLVTLRILPPPLPPANVTSEVSERKIRISWEPPARAADQETILYNLYRTEAAGAIPERPRNEKPLQQPFYDDEEFLFGKSYTYVVRSVMSGKAFVESRDSTLLSVTPQDVYPPAPPTGLAVSAENGTIKLYWFPNSEPDLAGYRIYRSQQEAGEFEAIASVGPAESTYADATAQPGVKYYYALTALDRSVPPNESARSEVHGDRLPPAGSKPGKKAPAKP
jgi:hypothetical protein